MILSDKHHIKLKDLNCHHIKDSLSKLNPWKDPLLECSGLKLKLDFTIVLFVIPDCSHSMLNMNLKQDLAHSGEEFKTESKLLTKKIQK